MEQARVVTVGVFDGVHHGHAALLRTTVDLAATEGLVPAAVTFHPHPKAVLRGMDVPMLTTIARRTRLLQQRGIEHVHVCTFDAARSQQSPEDFIAEVLVGEVGARMVVIGSGFRFGKSAAGGAQTLRDAGFIVHELPIVETDGSRVSSTRIRDVLIAGDVAAAQQLLGRPHRLEGLIVHGNARGREIGYPTANLAVSEDQLIPSDGVYAGWLVRGDVAHGFDGEQLLPAAISIGTNPTFDDVMERRVEAFVLDRADLDLYGEYVAFDFHSRIRGTEKFPDVATLLQAMAADVQAAKSALA